MGIASNLRPLLADRKRTLQRQFLLRDLGRLRTPFSEYASCIGRKIVVKWQQKRRRLRRWTI